MKWIFLSPHLDDAVLSCGGIIYALTCARQDVEIWTICAGDPPAGPLSPLAQILHTRWRTSRNAPEIRRGEDQTACSLLGARAVHFDIPECIYRYQPGTNKPLIQSNEELFQPLPEFEKPLALQLSQMLAKHIDSENRLVAPLAIGNHIDHHLVLTAAKALNRPLYFYPEYPYEVTVGKTSSSLISPEWQVVQFTLPVVNLYAWQASIAAYRTQISTFWSSLEAMKSSLHDYWQKNGGSKLWYSQPDPRLINFSKT
jgi:LmbE family N-acetylglucosaminyl deacetylase